VCHVGLFYSGGLTNALYGCQLSEAVATHSKEPRMALMRVYGKEVKMDDLLIITALSARNLDTLDCITGVWKKQW
jgi:hypothetical protein